MNILAFSKLMTILFIMLICSCADKGESKISGISISYPGANILNAQVEVQTKEIQNAFIRYRIAGKNEKPYVSQISSPKEHHIFLLTNLQPGQQYIFNIVTSNNKVSRDFFFKTIDTTIGIKDTLKVTCAVSLLYEKIDTGAIIFILKLKKKRTTLIVGCSDTVRSNYLNFNHENNINLCRLIFYSSLTISFV